MFRESGLLETLGLGAGGLVLYTKFPEFSGTWLGLGLIFFGLGFSVFSSFCCYYYVLFFFFGGGGVRVGLGLFVVCASSGFGSFGVWVLVGLDCPRPKETEQLGCSPLY